MSPTLLIALVLPAQLWAADARVVALYQARCETCHGAKGDGQGPAAYLLFPRPRDFTRGTFKFRSTPTGSLPTDHDLMHTVTHGIPGTAMPPSEDLPMEDRRALVAYVKEFSPRFKSETAPAPLAISAPPASTPARIAAGKKVYATMQCGACHGASGRGDGPSAATLKDDDGNPIRPLDFTRGGNMKGGDRPEDVYRTFTTGLDGTPMPGFGDSLKDQERWNLVLYALSLRKPSKAPPPSEKLVAFQMARLPADPADPAWINVPQGSVPLRSLWMRSEGVERVAVRAATDLKALALQIEWEDRIADKGAVRAQDFRDAVAVQFPLGEQPFFGMGHKGVPVNIWHWRADWQIDLAQRAGVETTYAAMHVDSYPPAEMEKAFLPGAAADNPMSRTRTSPVEDLNATGLGTLTSQQQASQDVSGAGVWADGKWRVVVQRPLATSGPADVQLAPGKTIPVAFAVWDGAAGDRNGQKRVSSWVELELPAASR